MKLKVKASAIEQNKTPAGKQGDTCFHTDRSAVNLAVWAGKTPEPTMNARPHGNTLFSVGQFTVSTNPDLTQTGGDLTQNTLDLTQITLDLTWFANPNHKQAIHFTNKTFNLTRFSREGARARGRGTVLIDPPSPENHVKRVKSRLNCPLSGGSYLQIERKSRQIGCKSCQTGVQIHVN